MHEIVKYFILTEIQEGQCLNPMPERLIGPGRRLSWGRCGNKLPMRAIPQAGTPVQGLLGLLGLLFGVLPRAFAPLSLDLGDIEGVDAAAPPPPPPLLPTRSLGGRLRTMAEDVLPTAIIKKIAEARKPPDSDGNATFVADDGNGCVATIGGDDIDGVNPLYRCAFDRKRCFPYGPVPPVIKDEPVPNPPYCDDGMIDWPTFFSPAEQGYVFTAWVHIYSI